MNKALILIFLFSITACKVIEDKYLYDKNSDAYPALEAAAAVECLTNNAIFNNLQATNFESYSILTNGSTIEIKDSQITDSPISHYITIIDVQPDKVIFSFHSGGGSSSAPYLATKNYSIERADNNKLVTMIANGVCTKSFTGEPSSSNSELTFSVDRFHITDTTSVDSTDTPGTYQRREDSYSLNTSMPAFLFLWNGVVKGTRKETEAGEATAFGVSSKLELTDLGSCPSEKVCVNPPGTAVVPLTVNESEFAQVRTTTDVSVKRFYFNEIVVP